LSYDAARIINTIAGKGVQKVGYQGIRLGTVTSVSPIKLRIDNINFEITSDSVVVNSLLIDPSIEDTERLKSGDRVAVSQIDIKVWAILCKVVNA
jgi:hypothetical protein